MTNKIKVPVDLSEQNTPKNFDQETITKILKDDNLGWKFWKKRRYIIGALTFFGFFVAAAYRVNINIALVEMSPTNTTEKHGEFKWDSKTKGYIKGSFYCGYIFCQILGGWLSTKIGSKKVIGCGITIATLLTILTPSAARLNVYLLIVLRIAIGIFLGMAYPSTHAMWTNWAPKLERSKLTSLTFAGTISGSFIGMPMTGVIATYCNWQWIFYIFGTIGIIWSVLWWHIVEDKPENDSRITTSELNYIKQSIDIIDEKKKIIYPWKAMLTSSAFWAIIVVHFCENWGFQTMIIHYPEISNNLFHNGVGKTSFQMALPPLGMTIFVIFSGNLSDYLISNNYFPTIMVRKIFICSASLMHSVFINCAGFSTSNISMLIFITIAISLDGFICTNFIANLLDIAPRHASILLGISNTIAMSSGIISLLLVAFIVQDMSRLKEWRIIFMITGALAVIGGMVYFIFGSGKVQKWARDTDEREINDGLTIEAIQKTTKDDN